VSTRRGWVLALAAFAACGGGGDGTTDPTPSGSFSVSLSPSTLNVVPGSTGSVTATIARTGSFTGTVTLSVEGLPTGVTGAFNPASITSGTTSTTLTVNAAANATPGTYTFTIRGSASGQTDRTATATLTVTQPPGLSFTVSPATLAVAIGEVAKTTLSFTRINLTTPIALAVSGAPTGVTVSLLPTNVTTEASSEMTVVVGATATPGSYPLTVTATAAGGIVVTAGLTLTVEPARRLQLEASATALTAVQGASRNTTVTITRTNVPGNVTLTASGAPNGVTVVVDPSPVTGNTATVTFNVGAAVTPGTYPIVLTATATGATSGTLPLTLTVTSSTPAAVALAMSRNPVTVEQASTDTTTVRITRTNYAQPVTAGVLGLPDGISVTSATENPTSSNAVRFTFTASATAVPGTYPLTVQVIGSGLQPTSTSLSLVVTASPPGTGNVTWNFENCAAAQRPIWLAAVGTGDPAFRRVSPNGNSFAFNIVTEGAVAYVTQNGADNFTTNFRYGLLAELQSTSFCATGPVKTVNGTIAGYGTSTQAGVSLGSSFQLLFAPQSAFALTNVNPGALDLLATRSAVNPLNPAAGAQVNKMIARRAINAANGSTLPVLDFDAGEAFDPIARSTTVNGAVAGETVFSSVNYITANGGFATLGQSTAAVGAPLPFATVPAARQLATDLHVLTASATAANGSTTRSATRVFKESADQVVTLGPTLATPTINIFANYGYLSHRVQLARQAEYDDLWTLVYNQTGRTVVVTLPSSQIGASPFEFVFPDLRSVAGWQNAWGPVPGASTTYSFTVSGWSGATGGFFLPYSEGALIHSATRTGTMPQ